VREIRPAEESKVKRVNVNIPLQLHNRFKSAAAARGENMTNILLEFIHQYVDRHTIQPKGRRK
jgi:predicted DNA binding CopG/RHH family protein